MPKHGGIECAGEHHIEGDASQGVSDGIVFLPHHIAEHHGGGIAGKTAPSARHIAILRHKNEVHGKEHRAAHKREHRTPDGFVDELVPKREVEIHAHHYLRRHHDGHHFQSFPVVGRDDALEHIDAGYHCQERQQGENDEIFHRFGVGVFVVAVFAFAKHEGLVGVAEGLGDERHNHGNFHRRTVDAELLGGVGAFVDDGEQNLVGGLIQDAGDAEHQDGPTVAQHAPQ